MRKDAPATTDSIRTQIALMQAALTNLQTSVTAINSKLDTHYITHEEFDIVRNIVFGMVGMIIITFFGVVIKFFIH
jgi:hypothetical protein